MQFLHKGECRIRLMKPPQNPISAKQSQSIALLLRPALTGAIALILTGCLAEPDGYRYAVPAGAGGNYAPAQPNYVPQPNYAPPARNSRDLPSNPNGYGYPTGSYAPQPSDAPPAQPADRMYTQPQPDDYTVPGVREVHYATSREHCLSMLNDFKRIGRRLRLTRTQPSQDPVLKYKCVFEGPDAVDDYFADPRYNGKQEN
jgi:hypothetical protein